MVMDFPFASNIVLKRSVGRLLSNQQVRARLAVAPQRDHNHVRMKHGTAV